MESFLSIMKTASFKGEYMKSYRYTHCNYWFNFSFAFVSVLGLFFAAASVVTYVRAEETTEQFMAKPVQLNDDLLLIAPHDNSVVVVSRLWLILKGEIPENVTLNGLPIRWDKHFGGDVRVGILRLEIGMQNLKIGDKEIRFALGRNEKDHVGPEDWGVYRFHNMKPGPNPCMRCHECEKQEDNTNLVGALMTPENACFKCHTHEKIDVQHSNAMLEANWKERCSDCHFIHASPYKYLLRNPRETYLIDKSRKEAPEVL